MKTDVLTIVKGIFLTFLLLLSFEIQSQESFLAPGTYQWTVPPCVEEITVKVWGAGGGGGGTSSHQTGTGDDYEACTEGGGGGGGGFAMRTYAVTPGEVYTIVVGAGGAAGTGVNNNASAGNGGDGNASTFDGPAVTPFGILTATGGTGGGGATANNTSGWAHIGDNGSGGAGGSGSNGTTNYTGGSGSAGSHSAACHDISGAGGGAAGPGGNGGNAQYIGPCPHPAMNGGSGQAPGGNGAKGQQGSINASRNIKDGNDGNAYGGGGSGGSIHLNSWANQWQKSNGGAGAHGAVIIEYTSGNTPNPPIADNQSFCNNAVVGDLVATGTDINWYDVPTGGTPLDPNDNLVTGTYYANQTVAGCESDRVAIQVTIFNPSFDNVPDIEECGEYVLPNISGNGLTGNETYYSQPNGTGTMYPAGSTITTSGTYYIYDETGTTPNCFIEEEFEIVINIAPNIDAGLDQEVCEGTSIVLSANNPDGAVITWDNGVIDGEGFIPTTGTYTVTADLNGCPETDQVNVIVNDNLIITVSSTPPSACGVLDGTISFEGLTPNTSYDVQYDDINGTQGPTSYISDANGIITITGLDAGVYTDVQVLIVDDCTVPIVETVNLSSADAPIVVAPADLAVCLGESVTLVAGNPDNGVISWSNNIIDGVPFTPTTDGTFTYTVSSTIGGCTSEDNVTVTVHPISSVDAGPDQDVCEGTQIVLSANNPDGAVITWDNGVIDGEGFIPTTGTYTVTADLNGCLDTDQVDVIVHDNLIITVSSTPPSACGVLDGTFSFEGLTPNTSYDIQYDDINGTQGPTTYISDANGVITVTGLGAGTYTDVQVLIVDDCTIPIGVTISLSSADAPVVLAPADMEVCLGESIILVADNPDNGVISWSNNIVDGVSFTPTTDGTFTYIVSSTIAGCTSEDNVTVIVHPLPNVGAGNDLVVCEGESVTLNGSGADTYSWSNGISNGVPFTAGSSTTTYSVTGTDSNGCVNTDEVSVNVNPQPEALFQGNNLLGCAPLQVNFTHNSNIGNGYTCEWNFGDGNTSADCNNVSHTYTSTGVYTVTLTITDDIGCQGTFTQINYIEVTPSPTASFSADPMTITTSSTVDFTNNSTNATDYTWDFGDYSSGTNEVHPSHTYFESEAGSYIVTLVASNGDTKCNDTSQLVIAAEEEVIFYVPNAFTPDGDYYNETFKPVFTSGFDPYTYTLQIFNRWGELIFESNNIDVGWDGTYGTKQPEMVQDGVYIWKIRIKEKTKDKHNEYIGHVNLIK